MAPEPTTGRLALLAATPLASRPSFRSGLARESEAARTGFGFFFGA